MRVTSKILLMAIVLWTLSLAGCKTTKEITSTESQVVETVQNDIDTKVDSSATVTKSDSVVETVSANENRVIEETIVELSQPDTSGVQYATKITTRKEVIGTQTETKTEAVSDSTAVSATVKTETDNTSKQTTTTIDTSTKVITKRNRIWRPIIVGLVLVAIPVVLKFRKPISTLFKPAFNWIKNCLKFLKSE